MKDLYFAHRNKPDGTDALAGAVSTAADGGKEPVAGGGSFAVNGPVIPSNQKITGP